MKTNRKQGNHLFLKHLTRNPEEMESLELHGQRPREQVSWLWWRRHVRN